MVLTQKILIKNFNKINKWLWEFSRKCCWFYNQALEQRKIFYKYNGKGISYYKQQKWFHKLRKEKDWLQKESTRPFREALRRLDLAFKAFFRRVKQGEKPGYPKFKSKKIFFGLFYPDQFKVINKKAIKLPKGPIIELQEEIIGKPKTVCITEKRGKFYCCLTYEKPIQKEDNERELLAIDLGIKNLATAVDEKGNVFRFPNPRILKFYDREIDKIKSKRDKCRKGSKRRNNWNRVLNRLWERRNNRISDGLHKLSRALVNLRPSTLIIGDLQVSEMRSKFHSINRAVQNNWMVGKLQAYLQYKQELRGGEFQKVDESYTTRTCYKCGHVKEKVSPSIRKFTCPECGFQIGRDENGALNIAKKIDAQFGPRQLSCATFCYNGGAWKEFYRQGNICL